MDFRVLCRVGLLALVMSSSLRAADGPPVRAPHAPANGNRLAYLDDPVDPYYVHRDFPKLITPQWVGEEGVDAVVTLGIDDMRDPAKYEAYLRPILDRLKQIDGRAPVSILTCKADPASPQLQAWLKEGLSIECHTADHPCPIWKVGDLAAAKKTYDDCVDQMAAIPANKPVAFRTPCCDSRNTPSPRIYAEIMNARTEQGRFLTIDSSVMNIMTASDPELPRDLVMNADGTERFRRYVPFKNFVNTIEDYPYPYVIGNAIWQFPCVTPSDWSAQNVNGKNHPRTVEDWKAALDAIVIKKGVFNLIFHPHGWIKAEQVVELIDYAQQKYGKRVKFLNFRECQERLDQHLLMGQPIRNPETGGDNGVRVMDVNNDGYMDVVIAAHHRQRTRIYLPSTESWATIGTPFSLLMRDRAAGLGDVSAHFGVINADGRASVITGSGRDDSPYQGWHFNGDRWVEDRSLEPGRFSAAPRDIRLRDLDGDGVCELIGTYGARGIYVYRDKWEQTNRDVIPYMTFDKEIVPPSQARFLDINEDGKLDLLINDAHQVSLYLFDSLNAGWSRLFIATRLEKPKETAEIPPSILELGTNNGMFVHSRTLIWQNEATADKPDLIHRVPLADLLGNRLPEAKSPQASLKAMKPRAGFDVQLVAAEPQVQDPVAFAFGADGKLWVVEMGDYPLGVDGEGKIGGKVKLLTDADGDGYYETARLFLKDLPYPTGVTPYRNGVLVTAAPDILYAEDTDGDGIADKREVLFTGFSEGNQQHRINGLTYGLDGWYYGANGHSNGEIKSIKTGKVVDIRGRDIRLKPDTGEFETCTGVTQFVRSRDDWGNWFGNDNTHPMFHLWAEERYHRRNPFLPAPPARTEVPAIPGASPVYPISRTLERFNQPTQANHFTSACSTIVYRDDLFGPGFAGNMIVSEPVHNLVSRQIMRPEGATFRSERAADEQASEFVASSDNWFRPTMIGVGPDGALYVADMYRLVIEHPKWIPEEWQQKLDLRAGADKGRIYRVAPVGVKAREIPRLDKMTGEQLVTALDSASGWQRDMAQQLLVQRADTAVIPALTMMLRESKNPLARLHALCTLDLLAQNDAREPSGSAAGSSLKLAMDAPHPGVRTSAVRIAEPHLKSDPALTDAVLKRAKDEDAQVRRQVAYTLGEIDDDRAGMTLAEMLTAHGDDPIFVASAMTSVRAKWLTEIAGRVTAAADDDHPPSPGVVLSLTRMAANQKNFAALAAMLANVAKSDNREIAAWRYMTVAAVLDGTAAEQVPEDLLVRLMLETDQNEARQACVRLSAIRDAGRRVAYDPRQPADHRIAAIELLGRPSAKVADEIGTLREKLLTPATPPDVQVAAVRAMVRSRHDAGPRELLAAWKQATPTVRGAMLDAILSRPAWASMLLAEIEAGRFAPQDIDAIHRQSLLSHKDEKLRGRAATLLQVANSDRQKLLDDLVPTVTPLAGDIDRGKVVYAKACAACHVLGGEGKPVGPDLAGVGDKSSISMLTAVIDPNRAVEPRYVSYAVDTKAGDTLTGILAGETASAISLLGPDGKQQDILRTDIVKLRSTGLSLMPEGLEVGLSPQDLADLFAYVREAKPTELLKPNRK